MTSRFLSLCAVQVVLYVLLVVNFRAVAQANVWLSIVSDVGIASINFFVLRKIASAEASESTVLWFGYVLGSALGSGAGIVASKWMMGA